MFSSRGCDFWKWCSVAKKLAVESFPDARSSLEPAFLEFLIEQKEEYGWKKRAFTEMPSALVAQVFFLD